MIYAFYVYCHLRLIRISFFIPVFEILQQFHQQQDWKSAFFSVIPKRKGAQYKKDSSDNDGKSWNRTR